MNKEVIHDHLLSSNIVSRTDDVSIWHHKDNLWVVRLVKNKKSYHGNGSTLAEIEKSLRSVLK